MSTGYRLVDRTAWSGGDTPGPVGFRSEKGWSGDDNISSDRSSENYYHMVSSSVDDPFVVGCYAGQPENCHQGTFRTLCGDIGFSFVWSSNDDLRLYDKLREQVAAHSFNAAIFLGEGEKSLRMVSLRARQLVQIIQYCKTGDLVKLQRIFGRTLKKAKRRTTQQLFLEYEFGWRPLLSDIQEAANAFFALTNKPLTRTYRVHRKVAGHCVDAWTSSVIPGECFTSKNLRLVLAEDYSPSASLGLRDVASVAWELVPYSFVADWVVPIGTYLRVRSFFGDISPLSFFSTTYKHGVCTSPPLGTFVPDDPVALFRSEIEVTREPVSLNAPAPKIRNLSEFATFRHALDSLALIAQHFR